MVGPCHGSNRQPPTYEVSNLPLKYHSGHILSLIGDVHFVSTKTKIIHKYKFCFQPILSLKRFSVNSGKSCIFEIWIILLGFQYILEYRALFWEIEVKRNISWGMIIKLRPSSWARTFSHLFENFDWLKQRFDPALLIWKF